MSQISMIILLFCLFWALFSQKSQMKFDQYLQKYKKNYSGNQYTQRKAIWEARVATFANITTYKPGINNLTDLKPDQLKKIKGLLTLTAPSGKTPPAVTQNFPASLNWYNHRKTSVVKNQFMCAASWAFAATGYAESKLMIDNRYDTIDLSEQRFLECTTQSNCSGGYLQYAMESVTNGVLHSVFMNYTPSFVSTLICKYPSIQCGKVVQNYYNLNDSQLITLLQERPIAISVSANGWENYASGVFQCLPTDQVNHAVLLVGYDSNSWVVKNSWGSDWGESGYIRIARTPGLNCKIGTSAHRTFEWQLYTTIMLVILLYVLIF